MEKSQISRKVKTLGGTEIDLRLGDLLTTDSPKLYSDSEREMEGFSPLILMVTAFSNMYIHFYAMSIYKFDNTISKIENGEIEVLNKKRGKSIIFDKCTIFDAFNYFAGSPSRTIAHKEWVDIYPRLMRATLKHISMMNYTLLNVRMVDLLSWPALALQSWARYQMKLPVNIATNTVMHEGIERKLGIEKALQMGIFKRLADKRRKEITGNNVQGRLGLLYNRNFINLGAHEHVMRGIIVFDKDITPAHIKEGTLIAVEGVPKYITDFEYGDTGVLMSFKNKGGEKEVRVRELTNYSMNELHSAHESDDSIDEPQDGVITVDSASAISEIDENKKLNAGYTHLPHNALVINPDCPPSKYITYSNIDQQIISGYYAIISNETESEQEKKRGRKSFFQKVKKVVSK